MSQFSANPSHDHIQKALYIVKYIAHTIDSKIVYKKNGSGFIAYADADWASDRITRISVTGYVLMLAEGTVSWVSRKQKTIAVTTHGLNVMHSGHVGPPGIISFYLSSFHSTLTPVLLVRYISISFSTYPMPLPFAQILYMRYPSPYETRI